MTLDDVLALITAATAFLGALAAVIHSVRTRQQVQAHEAAGGHQSPTPGSVGRNGSHLCLPTYTYPSGP